MVFLKFSKIELSDPRWGWQTTLPQMFLGVSWPRRSKIQRSCGFSVNSPIYHLATTHWEGVGKRATSEPGGEGRVQGGIWRWFSQESWGGCEDRPFG